MRQQTPKPKLTRKTPMQAYAEGVKAYNDNAEGYHNPYRDYNNYDNALANAWQQGYYDTKWKSHAIARS